MTKRTFFFTVCNLYGEDTNESNEHNNSNIIKKYNDKDDRKTKKTYIDSIPDMIYVTRIIHKNIDMYLKCLKHLKGTKEIKILLKRQIVNLSFLSQQLSKLN